MVFWTFLINVDMSKNIIENINFTRLIFDIGQGDCREEHGEPIKFLSLPKMGLLGSQASTEKKNWL